MRFDKKIAAGISALVLLVLYLLLRDVTFQSGMPEIADWKGDADLLTVSGPSGTVKLVREGDRWFVGEKKYPADGGVVVPLLKKMKELEGLELVAEKAYFPGYGLDGDSTVSASLSAGGKEVRKVVFGGKNSAASHTFVRINGSDSVYQLPGSFDSDLKKNVDDFRDRRVISLSPDAPEKLTISYRGKTYEINKVKKEGDEGLYSWQTSSGLELDRYEVESRIGYFCSVQASAFLPDGTVLRGEPICTVRVAHSGGETALKIYSRGDTDANTYRAASSESPYAFTIDSWKAEEFFIDNISKLKHNKKQPGAEGAGQ